MSSDSDRQERHTRRRFVGGFALYCVSGTALAHAVAPAAEKFHADLTAPERSLSFLHTHTGERLRADYFQGGQYQPECLTQVNYLLRDFRTGDVHAIDPALLDTLFALQVLAERRAVFEVISGYRSPATNAMLRRTTEGVAQHSMHLEGRAIDVRLDQVPTRGLARLARSLQRGGVGFYPVSNFVHVDTGPVRSW